MPGLVRFSLEIWVWRTGLKGGGAGAGGGRGHLAGEAEVENFYAALAGDHDVFGLEVAVDDAGGVGSGESVGKLSGEVRRRGAAAWARGLRRAE